MHHKTVYSCGHVKSQCRCPDPSKTASKTVTTLSGPCPACANPDGRRVVVGAGMETIDGKRGFYVEEPCDPPYVPPGVAMERGVTIAGIKGVATTFTGTTPAGVLWVQGLASGVQLALEQLVRRMEKDRA